MTNGFYNTDSINTKNKVKKFLDTAIKHSYNMVIQEKYRNGSSSREVRFDSSYAELLEEMLNKKEWELGVIDRFLYNRGAIKSADGEVVLRADWLFIYCHMSLPNLQKLVAEYNLKLIDW